MQDAQEFEQEVWVENSEFSEISDDSFVYYTETRKLVILWFCIHDGHIIEHKSLDNPKLTANGQYN